MRALLAAVAAVTALAAVPAGGVPAAAAQAPGAELELVAQTAWSLAGDGFELQVAADGADDDDEVVVRLHRPVTSRSQFRRTLEGRLLGRQVLEERSDLGELPAGPLGSRRITLSADRLAPLRTGVHPVSVEVGDERLVTHLVRLPAEQAEQPLVVSWVQPLGASPALQPDGERLLAPRARADLARVVEAVAASDVPLTLDLTPETVEALGLADDPLVDVLRTALPGRQVVAAPYVDVDPGALVAAGRAGRVGEQRRAGDEVLRSWLGRAGDLRVWSAGHPLSPAAVRVLRDLGVHRAVVPEEGLEQVDPDVTGGLTLAQPFVLAGAGTARIDAVVADAGLSAHFGHDDPVLGAHHLLADLAVLFLDAPGTRRGVVVRPPRGWDESARFLLTALPALGGAPMLQPTTVDTLFLTVDPLTEDGEPVVRRTEGEPGDLPGGALAAAGRAVEQLAAATGPENDVLATAERLLLVAEAEGLGRRRTDYVAAVTARADGVLGGVRLVDGRTFRLTAREGVIPLTFHNDNPFPVTVDVVLSSEKLEFSDEEGSPSRQVLRDLELPPGTRTVTVPVKARTSAAFSLRATLLAPGGQEIARSRYTVISTVVSGVGIVLSVGAAGFLLVWWASHWRSARRDRRLVPEPRL